MYAIYMLQCSDQSYYTGLTNDLEKRTWQHETGFFKNCYTCKRRPVKLCWHTVVETAEEAAQLEKQIKGWSRKKKEALITGDINELKRLSNLKTADRKQDPEPGEGSGIKSSPKIADPSPGSGPTIIIGQGVSGTFLSWYLEKAGLPFIIIDESKPHTASKAAAGIINPVTGRRIVKTWMIDELLPFAWDAYQEIGKELNINCISQKNIIDFFPTPQMRNAFFTRYEEDQEYLKNPTDENDQRDYFNYDFGYGEIEPCWLVDLPVLLAAYRKKLIDRHKIIEERFDINKLVLSENKVEYKNIQAEKIIFSDGMESFSNPFFKNLPFAPNKGEALIVEIKDIPDNHIYKKGISLVPIKEGLFWAGASYEWNFENDQPTEVFRKRTEQVLKEWLKMPFKTIEHIASVRPATVERRPFAGFHPIQKNMGILNGMGTKGCSLAPYFARQLANKISHQSPLNPEVDIARFSKILSRNVRN